MAEGFKIAVKLGNGAQFDAEGPEELVKAAYGAFLEAAKTTPNSELSDAGNTDTSRNGNKSDQDVPSGNKPSRSLMERVFRVDGEIISLSVLPKTENSNADALLLLLYGYGAIKSQHDVTAVRLAQAAKQTGIQIDRLDRTIAQIAQYVVRAGFKKGVRYGINNPGIRRAEELIVALLD